MNISHHPYFSLLIYFSPFSFGTINLSFWLYILKEKFYFWKLIFHCSMRERSWGLILFIHLPLLSFVYLPPTVILCPTIIHHPSPPTHHPSSNFVKLCLTTTAQPIIFMTWLCLHCHLELLMSTIIVIFTSCPLCVPPLMSMHATPLAICTSTNPLTYFLPTYEPMNHSIHTRSLRSI